MFCRALYFGGAFKKQQQQNFCDFFFIPKVDQFKETDSPQASISITQKMNIFRF